MNFIKFSIKNVIKNPLDLILNITLLAFGSGMITVMIVAGNQLSQFISSYSKGIDLVVGAKGSPMQLILSSIYHIDFPTGNIPHDNLSALASHPLVEKIVPLSLGDSYQSLRIVGTDENFMELYSLKLSEGKIWESPFDAVVGAKAAKILNLETGSRFSSVHGLGGEGFEHHHSFTVSGILQQNNSVVDNLILTSLESYWHLHAHDEDDGDEKEITSALIQYKTPLAITTLPGFINQNTAMMAASPALETARLTALTNNAFDAINIIAILVIVLATFSIFIGLYRTLNTRKKEIALMRILGAGRLLASCTIIFEGLVLALAGGILGVALGHICTETISLVLLKHSQIKITGLTLYPEELYLLLACGIAGIGASIIPSVKAYKTDVSTIMQN